MLSGASLLASANYLSALQAVDAIYAPINSTCSLSVAKEASGARELASLFEDGLEAQTTAKTPRVAQEANNALVFALQPLDGGLQEFVDSIEAGEDRETVGPELAAELLPSTLKATDAIRDLLERRGIPIGIGEPEDGVPPRSNRQCSTFSGGMKRPRNGFPI